MGLTVIKAGIQDTIQDFGRFGFQHLGINPTGVMDRFSMQVANILVGNKNHEAVLEMHFPASVLLFNEPALIALAGADFAATINGETVPCLHPVLIAKNDVLQFHKPVSGGRVYLAVRGGFNIPEWLGSRSTHLKAHSGGFRGRALQKNDELSLGTWLYPEKANYNGFVVLPWQADIHPAVKGLTETDPSEIWVLPGNEWDRLSSSGKDNFLMTSFLVRQQSDRMGYRLDNIPLPVLNNEELVSSAVSFGTIQLLPGGKLILLMADHQTSGGYPRIAHVITAHHSKIAQKKAGDRIHFHLTEQKIAEELLTRQQRHLQQLAFACNERLENFLKQYN